MGLVRLWRRLAQPKRGIFIASLLMAVLSLASGVALLAVSAWLIVRASERPAILTLTVAIVSVRFFGLARPVFRYVERVLSHEAVLRTLGRIRSRMVASLAQVPPTHPLFARRGELLSRLVGDVEKSQDFFLRLVSPVLSAIAVVLLASSLQFAIDNSAGIVMLFGLLLTLLIASLASLIASRQASTAAERGQLSGAINELVRGAEELHMWGASAGELERVMRLDKAVTARARKSVRGLGSGSFVILIGLGMTIAAIIPGALNAYKVGEMAWPTMAVLVLLPLALLDVLLPVPTAISLAAEVRSSLNRIDAVVDDPVELAVGTPKANDLVLTNVAASWDGQTDQISDINVTIPYGTKVAIIGPSGSGKTTLALVLAGLLEPSRGDALFGGVDIWAIKDEDRAKSIVFAAQDAYLFDTSIRQNMLIADPDMSDSAMMHFFKVVGLDTWVESRGLDFFVGENGAFLSGGQRRRMTIAQALAASTPITIIDEPTAHLDVEGGDALLRELFRSTGTRIVITHRLTPLREGLADLILVMEQGRLVEQGTHEVLMAQNGRYAALRYTEATAKIAV